MGVFDEVEDFFGNVWDRIRGEHAERRRCDKEREEAVAIDTDDPEKILAIDLVGFYEEENAAEHHTDEYELVKDEVRPSLVVRRGQTFTMSVSFKERDPDYEHDDLRLIFNYGLSPNVAKETSIVLQLSDETELKKMNHDWDVALIERGDKSLSLKVQIACDAMVGLWECRLVSCLKSNPQRTITHVARKDIYILFNPWCEEDAVYLADEEEREEYVMNDVGKVWVGTYRSAHGRPWVFGQFDDSVLLASVLVLDRCSLPPSKRGDPVLISRAISRMVNSNDDNGVIVGNWSGDYKDGAAPTDWSGSIKILEKYLTTGRPVKYGQCWVFAAVVNSVCRSLGLPCRVVSNLVSAHDTNMTLSIDYYFDEEGEKIENWNTWKESSEYGNDSVWNFHVWNEAWMSRPDLPQGYGGWQAIDATPQEASEGIMQCGPASVEAIRQGEVTLQYDVPFVFSEVNADVVHWQRDASSRIGYKRINVNKYHVGRSLMTKKPGKTENSYDDGMDVKGMYKTQEGTQAERAVVMNAVGKLNSLRAKRFHEMPSTKDLFDVKFDLEDIETVEIGKPFSITVNLENMGNSTRKITISMSATSVYYNGIAAYRIKDIQGVFVLQPNRKEVLRLQVPPDQYMDKLVEHCIIKMYAMACVEETKQTWREEDDFEVVKPCLNTECPEECQVGQKVPVTFSFKNPLSRTLTNCLLTFEGPGLGRPKTVRVRNIGPEEEMTHTHHFIPKRTGVRNVVGTFGSRELVDITGVAKVTVN